MEIKLKYKVQNNECYETVHIRVCLIVHCPLNYTVGCTLKIQKSWKYLQERMEAKILLGLSVGSRQDLDKGRFDKF